MTQCQKMTLSRYYRHTSQFRLKNNLGQCLFVSYLKLADRLSELRNFERCVFGFDYSHFYMFNAERYAQLLDTNIQKMNILPRYPKQKTVPSMMVKI